jgi:transcriptional regulator with XRE-family HTH domain
MKTINEILIDRIKFYRLKKGMRGEDLAEAIGKSVGAIRQIETGVFLPTMDTLWAISVALGVGVSQLLEDPNDSQSSEARQFHEMFLQLSDAQRETIMALMLGYSIARERLQLGKKLAQADHKSKKKSS